MAAKRLTQPTTEPVTLADVKDQLSIRDTVQDAIITRRIKEAREYCEEFLQRSLMLASWKVVLDKWYDAIELDYPPIASITSVSYLDAAGATQVLASAAYYLDNFSEPGWLLPAYGYEWPVAASIVNAVSIEYVAGYADADAVPHPIKEAIMLLVGHWMNHQADAESGVVITRVPLAVEQLLQPYRVIRL